MEELGGEWIWSVGRAWFAAGMAGGGESGEERKLDQTPTWAVASVCAVIIIISILLEKVLEKVGKVVFFFFNF